MKITTASGTQYIIEDIKEEEGKAFNIFTGKLARVSDHAIFNIGDTNDGTPFDNSHEFHEVMFVAMPKIGSSFRYIHPVWDGCVSTAVQEIEE